MRNIDGTHACISSLSGDKMRTAAVCSDDDNDGLMKTEPEEKGKGRESKIKERERKRAGTIRIFSLSLCVDRCAKQEATTNPRLPFFRGDDQDLASICVSPFERWQENKKDLQQEEEEVGLPIDSSSRDWHRSLKASWENEITVGKSIRLTGRVPLKQEKFDKKAKRFEKNPQSKIYFNVSVGIEINGCPTRNKERHQQKMR